MLIKIKDFLPKYIVCEYKDYDTAIENATLYNLDIIAYPEIIEVNNEYTIPSNIHCIDNIISDVPIFYKIGESVYKINNNTRIFPVLANKHPITIICNTNSNLSYIKYEFKEKILKKLYKNPVSDNKLYYYNGDITVASSLHTDIDAC